MRYSKFNFSSIIPNKTLTLEEVKVRIDKLFFIDKKSNKRDYLGLLKQRLYYKKICGIN